MASAQEAPLAWDQVQYYRYNILSVAYDGPTRAVTVILTVTNPAAGNAKYDVLGATAAPAFKSPATLRVDVAWNAGNWGATELVNTKDSPFLLAPRTTPPPSLIVTGSAPASASSVNVLAAGKRCSDAGSPCASYPDAALTYWVRSTLPLAATGAGRVGLEGHPSILVDPINSVYASIPVKSVWRDFRITAGAAVRRQVVDFNKCKVCHDGGQHGGTIVPRMALHGANRNEEPQLCVVCHNPDNTDAAYRTSGAEESIDFKRMIHGIHAGGFRTNPLVIIGRNGSVNDFSSVRFPAELRNCLNCHIQTNNKGTFELPLVTTLGSTISSLSPLAPLPGAIDIDPSNNLRISPMAATCSGCHDSSEVRRHMTSNGASFGVTQLVLAGRERCVNCHGPGREEDVRRAHEIGGSGESGSRRD
jgi:OmcA/MtrC family decaheme c-type cytochrome